MSFQAESVSTLYIIKYLLFPLEYNTFQEFFANNKFVLDFCYAYFVGMNLLYKFVHSFVRMLNPRTHTVQRIHLCHTLFVKNVENAPVAANSLKYVTYQSNVFIIHNSLTKPG